MWLALAFWQQHRSLSPDQCKGQDRRSVLMDDEQRSIYCTVLCPVIDGALGHRSSGYCVLYGTDSSSYVVSRSTAASCDEHLDNGPSEPAGDSRRESHDEDATAIGLCACLGLPTSCRVKIKRKRRARSVWPLSSRRKKTQSGMLHVPTNYLAHCLSPAVGEFLCSMQSRIKALPLVFSSRQHAGK